MPGRGGLVLRAKMHTADLQDRPVGDEPRGHPAQKPVLSKPVQLGLITSLLCTSTAVLKRFAKRARRAAEIKPDANGDMPAALMR